MDYKKMEKPENICKEIKRVLLELNDIGVPKRNANGFWPIESSNNEISTRNPGLGYFLEMDKRYHK